MKIKPIGLIFAILITALAIYIFYVCNESEPSILGLIIGGICVLSTSVMSLGITAPHPRTSILSIVVATVSLILFCCVNIGLALISGGTAAIIITNGIMLLIYFLTTYGIWQAKQ